MRADRAGGDPAMQVPRSVGGRVPRSASDARAHAIAEGVWALQLPLCYLSVSSTNAYLLASDDGWVLVDCGSCLDPGWEAMEVALKGAGVAPAELSLLVVTHSHADHRGLAAEVVRQTGCELAMGPPPHPMLDALRDPTIPLDVRRTSGRREGVPAHTLDRIVNDLPGDDGVYPTVAPSRTLTPGEQLHSLCGDWQVIPTPGHSGDQIALWNARHRRLISADLALPGPAAYLEYGTRPDPYADQVASLERVIALGPELVLPGHGRPVPDAVRFLAQCRERALHRLRLIADALDERPRSGWEIASMITPPAADAGWWQRSLAEALAILEHLESEVQARSIVDESGVRRWLASARRR